MTDTLTECAAKCDRPAPYGFVCYHCIDEAQARLDSITPEQQYDLLLIARGDARPANRNLISGGTGARMDALNCAVYSLLHDVLNRWPNMLPTLHRQPDAARQLQQIEQGCQSVQNLTEPQDESKLDDKYLAMRMAEISLKRPAEMVAFMWYFLGIRISENRIYKWRQRGLIEPGDSNKWGDTWYHPVDILHAIDSLERKETSLEYA